MNRNINPDVLSKISKYNRLIELINNLTEEEMSILIMVINSIQMEKNLLCGQGD